MAREQTQQVAAEAGQQAKQLLRRTEQEVSDQAGAQQRRLAAGLHAVGEELASMAKGSATNGAATDLVRQAADRSHALGSWFEDRTRALSWRTSETSHDGGRWHSWLLPPELASSQGG